LGLSKASKNNLESSLVKEQPMEYIAFLHKDKNSDFGVSFPDFPGCISAGSTLEAARKMAAEALAMHVAGMRADGEPIPEPSSLDDLRGDPAMKGAVAFLTELREPERVVRINITARKSQIAEIDRRARAKGLTRSSYIVQSALKEKAASR
jgi:predicted RNase H-like HicB family nuclease